MNPWAEDDFARLNALLSACHVQLPMPAQRWIIIGSMRGLIAQTRVTATMLHLRGRTARAADLLTQANADTRIVDRLENNQLPPGVTWDTLTNS